MGVGSWCAEGQGDGVAWASQKATHSQQFLWVEAWPSAVELATRMSRSRSNVVGRTPARLLSRLERSTPCNLQQCNLHLGSVFD